MRDLLLKIGLVACGGNYESVRQRLLGLGLLDDRFCSRPSRRAGRDGITDQALLLALDASSSRADLLRSLGLPTDSRSYAWLKHRLVALGEPFDTLNGQGWAAGRVRGPKRPLSQLLVEGRLVSSVFLKKRLVAEGVLPWQCALCSLTEWSGEPVPLELDHVSGDRYDNRLENLRLLCPNCHALTPTYRGRNIGKGRLLPRPD